ncbi:class I adenylate-forming enzyme family protein [Kitasatospora sp. NPDC089509]|uniref:class I adenylate-forming enzyme family protein n=1 Tax=Kitasatospora sp. NPDC089509 TaxID=3364079 RepID=UPI0038180596
MADGQRLGAAFLAACAEHGERRAVVAGGEELSYARFAALVRERARTLDALLGPDLVNVGLHAANSIDYLVCYYALLVAGRLPFLIDATFGAAELEGIRTSCGVPAFLFDGAEPFPLGGEARAVPDSALTLAVPPAPAAAPESGEPESGVPVPGAPEPGASTATCRFTSGTTGAPKCLEFTADAVIAAARTWAAGTGLGPDDRVLCLAGFTNGLAFNTSLLPVFTVGAELHLYQGLPTSGGISRAVTRAAATRLVAFPLAYRLLAAAPRPDVGAFAGVTRAVSAAAVLDPEVRRGFESRYGVRIADYYGIAETGPCTYEREPDRSEGLGTALPGVSVKVVELPTGESEVRVRTDSMAAGYLNAPGALAERLDPDGYYRTGDLGHLADGRLFVTGRLGGPINLAGRKIDPAEIERTLLALDGVTDAAVFADTDANGETVLHAALAGSGRIGRAEVVDACRARLAPFKVPGRVTFLPAIPRSTVGKARMTELRRLVRDTRAADGTPQELEKKA